jgi:glycosyltransferase involved in cell wall biosynthesis
MQNSDIRILTVNHSDNFGGAARAAFRIHSEINNYGVDSTFLVKYKHSDDNKVVEVNQFDSNVLLKAPFRWIKRKVQNKIQQYQWSFYPEVEDFFLSDFRGESLNGALKKIDYDLLHLHWINQRFINVDDLVRISKPIVWTLHDCWAFTGICHYFYKCERYKESCGFCPHLNSNKLKDISHKVWKKKLKIYQKLNIHIVCPSNWLAQEARKSTLLKNIPVSVIPNPVDTLFFMPGSKKNACNLLGLDINKNYLLYGAVNAFKDKNKGFKEIKSCLKYFETNFDYQNIELIVFGSNENPDIDLNYLKCRNLGMLNDQQIRNAYIASSLIVVPSLSENLSNIIMESLSCGTPVVAFNIGGNPDLIDHKINGYLAKAFDTDDLAHGIDFCLKNNLEGVISNSAREKVVDCFEMKNVGMQYVDLYKTVLNLK